MNYIYLTDTHSHRNTNTQLCLSIAPQRRISMPIQHKEPPTHTYSMHTKRKNAHTHTHTPPAPERGKHKSLTSSCIMCLKCSRETAKQAVTVTALKWGGITQVSFDLEVKAICDTIFDSLFPIEDYFDVIVRKAKIFYWTEFSAQEAPKKDGTKWPLIQ